MRRPVELRGGSAGGLLMNCLFHKDLATGDEQHWWCGPVSSLQEPCFIPRHKAAPEGDGWIVQICNRLDEQRSELLLFDALRDRQGTDRRRSTSRSGCASACTVTGRTPAISAWPRRRAIAARCPVLRATRRA